LRWSARPGAGKTTVFLLLQRFYDIDAGQLTLDRVSARAANVEEFVRRLPEGYSSAVGERGVRLSGGQRQRIAIAHAIVKDAPLLLLVAALQFAA
jgi:ATP-binding cassette, subfamily B, bacterial